MDKTMSDEGTSPAQEPVVLCWRNLRYAEAPVGALRFRPPRVCGLSEQDVQRVFERFYRTDSSRARTSGGTGLGLSIVDSLTRAHGGTVTVISPPGAGCTFRVTIPRLADVPAERPAEIV